MRESAIQIGICVLRAFCRVVSTVRHEMGRASLRHQRPVVKVTLVFRNLIAQFASDKPIAATMAA